MDNIHDMCGNCNKQAKKKCGKCKRIRYCSVECQLHDWRNHKESCAITKPEDTVNAKIIRSLIGNKSFMTNISAFMYCANLASDESLLCQIHITENKVNIRMWISLKNEGIRYTLLDNNAILYIVTNNSSSIEVKSQRNLYVLGCSKDESITHYNNILKEKPYMKKVTRGKMMAFLVTTFHGTFNANKIEITRLTHAVDI